MAKKEGKKMYKPDDIYFGQVFVDTRIEGIFYTGPEPFIKQTDRNGNITYKRINNNGSYKEYTELSKEYLTVGNLFCITRLMPEEKATDLISEKMIKLYLFKYKMKSFVRRREYIPTNQNQKVKK